ncbi:MAG: peptide-methionine (R)-S-oxide reductase MsrB [Candidatus Aenigmarchaeota archaeon]|nr:peptide-methionine (R)-S-oxide reductase MsrB [Candidatus Aenigmarchaeota archaeon]
MPISDEEWQKKLTPEQYSILRKKGTEPPFTGKLLYNKDKGTYMCTGCGAELFSSEAKYDSGSGWPSFWKAEGNSIELKEDRSHDMVRTEVLCKRCGGHLGHLFSDKPAGKRFCINSAALKFRKGK